jgi:hypothetical protein
VGEHSEFSDVLSWSGVLVHVTHVFNKHGNLNQVRRFKLRELWSTKKKTKDIGCSFILMALIHCGET